MAEDEDKYIGDTEANIERFFESLRKIEDIYGPVILF